MYLAVFLFSKLACSHCLDDHNSLAFICLTVVFMVFWILLDELKVRWQLPGKNSVVLKQVLRQIYIYYSVPFMLTAINENEYSYSK